MGIWIDVVRGAAVLNVLLLLGLCAIWIRNARQFRSKHTLGLLIFGILLLAENALAVYFFALDPTLSGWFYDAMPTRPARAMMTLRVVETGALVLLAWVTMD
jgi:hypothetical protein